MKRRIYYDIFNGSILVDTGERYGIVIPTSVADEISTYKVLTDRNRDSFDFIELEYGAYEQDFRESVDYRVNIETKELEFIYKDSDESELPPVFRKPLSLEVEELKVAQAETNTNLLEFMETVLLS